MSLKLLSLANKLNFCAFRRIATSSSLKIQNASLNLVAIEVNDKTGFATLSLNQPPVNSLNLNLFTALINALDELEKNKSRGVILSSVSSTFRKFILF